MQEEIKGKAKSMIKEKEKKRKDEKKNWRETMFLESMSETQIVFVTKLILRGTLNCN